MSDGKSNADICDDLAEVVALETLSLGSAAAEELAKRICIPSAAICTILMKSKLSLGERVMLLRTVTEMCEQMIAEEARQVESAAGTCTTPSGKVN